LIAYEEPPRAEVLAIISQGKATNPARDPSQWRFEET